MSESRRRPSSLRARSLLVAALGMSLAMLLSGAVIWGLFAEAVERQFDERFQEYLNVMTAAVHLGPDYETAFASRLGVGTDRAGGAGGVRPADAAPFDPRLGRAYGGIYWMARRVVRNDARDDQELTFRSVSLWDFQLRTPEPAARLGEPQRLYSRIPGPGGSWLRALQRRVRVERTGDEWLLTIAADEASLAASRASFRRALILSLSALGLALLAAAALQSRFVLSPLRPLRGALAEYRAGRAPRIEGAYPSEIAPLVEDLNGLLDRNERWIAQGRRRAADLAHEMKTPVAVLRNELDALAARHVSSEGGPPPGSESLSVAFDALAQIERQTRRQLARARVGALQGSRTRLRPAAERLRRTMLRLHQRPLKIWLDLPAELVFNGDEEDLEELLGELMNNACLWARGALWVSAAAVETLQGERLRLTVEDDGPGVAPEQHARMLSAGGRLDSRRPGSGIGLAMVADLVEAYDGELSLGRGAAGGLQVRLLLPGARAP
ncbi:sensor histidine kinase [Neomegalonema perideroedes]|uniref:sensor histidine kinase n=1 Tax=Neomegalonema perideroedes TaxID=217219 RepID=UPI000376C3FF|nr:HAMP domain-containing sensor histidine kinase [Neomegalonema perideroedes]